MNQVYDPDPPSPRPRPFRTALFVALVAFVAGVALVTWAFTRWEPAKRLLVPAQQPAKTGPLTVAPPALAPTVLPSAVVQPSEVAVTDSRVAGLEARLAQIDARAAVASVNASRAEGLLIAFAARRVVERGTPLGYLEAQLRSRFGDTQPRAVAAVISAAQAPVTVDTLRAQLDRLAPQLGGGGPDEAWTDTLRRAVGGLIVVRKAETPSPAADQRLARARAALEGRQVDVALAEIARLPARGAATDWMAAARRYIEAQRALDILEASALTTGTPTP
jgi:hypothetical protein